MFKISKISIFLAFFVLLLVGSLFIRPFKASAATNCEKDITFFLTLQDASFKPAASLRFEVYEQKTGTNALASYGNRVGEGLTDVYGQGKIGFKPDSSKIYALKVWDKSGERGEFWFYDAIRFSCTSDRSLTKQIPSLTILLRGINGELKKDFPVSLYVQRFDSENKPYFTDTDLITSTGTNAAGELKIYLAPYNSYSTNLNTGFYALSFRDESGKQVNVYGISPYNSSDKVFEYRLTGLSASLKNAAGEVLAERDVRLYEQLSYGKIGKELAKTKTDTRGYFSFEYPIGTYAISVLDDFKREDFFWNNVISSGLSEEKSLRVNLTRFLLVDAQGEDLPDNPNLEIYALNGDGPYTRGEKITSLSLESDLKGSASLAAGKYLAVYYGQNSKEYGQAFEVLKGRIQNVKVMINAKYSVKSKSFTLSDIQDATYSSSVNTGSSTSGPAPSSKPSVNKGLRGRILLQVEAKGEAWYVNPIDNKRYFLGRPQDAFDLMRRFGLGISNSNFNALNTNPNAYSALAGRILLKVEDSGKAYYFDPVNLKLYYLGRPTDAFNVIRSRGLGISNQDIDKLNQGN